MSGFGMGSPPGGHGAPSQGGGYTSPGGGFDTSGGPSILGGGGPVPAGGGFRPPKKGGSGGLIAAIAVAVLLLGGIIGLMVFLLAKKGGSIAADPSSLPPKQASVAFKHLPSGCEVVMRANVGQMLEVPAVKTHLAPLLEEIQANAATDPDAKSVDELVKSAGIDVKTDLKDFAVCMTGLSGPESGQKFLFVGAGDLRPETFVPAWEKVDGRTTERPTVSKSDGRMVGRARTKDGETIIAGQASDGAIVLSNDEMLFAGAAKDSSLYQSEYALPTGSEAALTLGSAVLRDALAQGGPNPFLKDVNAITRIIGTASLAQAKLEVRVLTTSAQAAKSLLDIYSLMLAPMMKQELARAKGKAPGVEVLMNAKPAVEGNDFVLSAQGTPADVDSAARELARLLREERKKGALAL